MRSRAILTFTVVIPEASLENELLILKKKKAYFGRENSNDFNKRHCPKAFANRIKPSSVKFGVLIKGLFYECRLNWRTLIVQIDLSLVLEFLRPAHIINLSHQQYPLF